MFLAKSIRHKLQNLILNAVSGKSNKFGPIRVSSSEYILAIVEVCKKVEGQLRLKNFAFDNNQISMLINSASEYTKTIVFEQ